MAEKPERRPIPPRPRTRVLVVAAIVVASLGVTLIAARLTDEAWFCRSCHEMVPYVDAWQASRHRSVQCVECHVAPGAVSRLAHKFVALAEVRVHIFGDPRFPIPGGAPVPDARCAHCHARVPDTTFAPVTRTRFSHAFHAKQGRCWTCHTETAHRVDLTALAAIGVLSPGASATPASLAVGTPRTARPGHVATACVRCHDQSKMGCDTCHRSPHPPRGGTCVMCHAPGPVWRFSHPASASNCVACHAAPANHFGPDCKACHHPGTPFAATPFNHPPAGEHNYLSFPCVRCHPKTYAQAFCTCHGGNPPREGD